jgi:hypothetical protein
MSLPDEAQQFLDRVEPFSDFIGVTEPAHYRRVPGDWHVAVADVVDSTGALALGRYKDVNALGAACIVAALNAAGSNDLPYVFGGDGASIVIPPSLLPAVRRALAAVRTIAREAFDLELRVGTVPVAELDGLGAPVELARFRLAPAAELAMFAGGGLRCAEALVKRTETEATYAVREQAPGSAADLEGFECRWDPVPSIHGHVVALLAVATGAEGNAYRRLLEQVALLGPSASGRPVAEQSLTMATRAASFDTEARLFAAARSGWRYAVRIARARAKTAIGRWLMVHRRELGGFDGAGYAQSVAVRSDFRKFDDTLRMVLDLSSDAADELEGWLREAHRRGELHYGLSRSKAALVTCLVRDFRDRHIHFVDGADGGYALAARALKEQLAQSA